MAPNWQQEIIRAIDESLIGKQGVYLDSETEPITELRALTPEQATLVLPGAGNAVANQVMHLLTTIAMHEAQFMGGAYPDLDWGADWDQQSLNGDAWHKLLDRLEDAVADLKTWIIAPAIEQNQEYAAASIMVVAHLAYHFGQIRHAAGYAQNA